MTTSNLRYKNILLQADNARLKQQLGKAINDLYYWKERVLFFQSERDYFGERRSNLAL
jgi:hypothetical protein